MISVWLRFAPGSSYYCLFLDKNWFEEHASECPPHRVSIRSADNTFDVSECNLELTNLDLGG